MRLIVGLGNPGEQYQNTRHNVGFMVADELSKKGDTISEVQQGLHKVTIGNVVFQILIPPRYTPGIFMNTSGKAVKEAVDYYKIPIEDVWVIQDEADLPLGVVKVKRGGADAGHRGIRSIDSNIGNDYWRIRVGVGRPPAGQTLTERVLSRLSSEEKDILARVIDQATDLLVKFLESDIEPTTITI